MSLFSESLPETVQIGGAERAINSSFRVSVAFAEMVRTGGADELETTTKALAMYYPEIRDIKNHHLGEAIEQMLIFFRCGKTGKEMGEKERKKSARILSYEEDSGYIYAAFLQQYGIDLTREDPHWWTFRALFDGLAEDIPIVKIMGFRGMEITNKLSPEHKSYYRRMKKAYALDTAHSAEELTMQAELNKALGSGGDVASILAKYKR